MTVSYGGAVGGDGYRLSVALLLLFAFAAFFQPWRKWFEPAGDYDALDRDL